MNSDGIALHFVSMVEVLCYGVLCSPIYCIVGGFHAVHVFMYFSLSPSIVKVITLKKNQCVGVGLDRQMIQTFLLKHMKVF